MWPSPAEGRGGEGAAGSRRPSIAAARFAWLIAVAGTACSRPHAGLRSRLDPAATDRGCPDIFRQDGLRRYQIDLSPEVWREIAVELAAGPPATGAPPYHPVLAFRYGTEARADARVRLKGNSSWAYAVAQDPEPKAQFVVAFGDGATRARFHGVHKISFDMPRSDETMLAERLALGFMRAAGLPAPCANSAELYVNGQAYGLYTSKETFGGTLLDRLFPGAASGVLLDQGVAVAENANAYDSARARALWAAHDLPGMRAAGVDLEGSLRTWAAEAIVNDGDGYWGGNHNFYIYDHPRDGWRWLSDDVDAAFAWIPRMQHPVYWWLGRASAPPIPPQHYLAVITDAAGRALLAAAVADVLDHYDVAELQGSLDAWAAEIADAAARDPHRPFTLDRHRAALAATRAELAERAAYLGAFLACARGIAAPDDDGDGHPSCFDCDDTRPDVHSGAAEICGDGVDQDCDGVADQGCRR